MEKDGITAAAIHSNKSQGARTRALADFKQHKICALVATDIAARGLDIEQFFEEAHRLTAERDPGKVISDGLISQYMLQEVELTNISDEYYFQTVEIQELIVDLLLAFDSSALAPEPLPGSGVDVAALQAAGATEAAETPQDKDPEQLPMT